jgi:hypothetical protein
MTDYNPPMQVANSNAPEGEYSTILHRGRDGVIIIETVLFGENGEYYYERSVFNAREYHETHKTSIRRQIEDAK